MIDPERAKPGTLVEYWCAATARPHTGTIALTAPHLPEKPGGAWVWSGRLDETGNPLVVSIPLADLNEIMFGIPKATGMADALPDPYGAFPIPVPVAA